MSPRPIRLQLTAWYVVILLVTLAVASLTMYFGIQKAIEDTVDAQLQVRRENIERFLQTSNPEQTGRLPQALPAAAGLAPGDDLYQITDGFGAMLFQSAAMHDLQVPLDIDQLQHHYRHHRDQGSYTTYYRRHGDVRVLASTLQLGGSEYRIQVATDVNPLYSVLETFRKWVWFMLPLIVALAGIGGYVLTSRAMKPVQDLVYSTRNISEHNLSKRIAVPRARDELRELAETINAMLGRLESAFARITRFTADASHELRTPIAVIRTTAEVLLERERSTAEVKDMVGLILHESESTTTLIEQLLILARADADSGQLTMEAIDLRTVVNELEASCKALAEARGVHWSAELPAWPVNIWGDRIHLRRLFLILLRMPVATPMQEDRSPCA